MGRLDSAGAQAYESGQAAAAKDHDRLLLFQRKQAKKNKAYLLELLRAELTGKILDPKELQDLKHYRPKEYRAALADRQRFIDQLLANVIGAQQPDPEVRAKLSSFCPYDQEIGDDEEQYMAQQWALGYKRWRPK